jgi:hypothetical protein
MVALGVASPAQAATVTFGFDVHSWIVPPGVFEATFDVYGAQGGRLTSETMGGGPWRPRSGDHPCDPW